MLTIFICSQRKAQLILIHAHVKKMRALAKTTINRVQVQASKLSKFHSFYKKKNRTRKKKIYLGAFGRWNVFSVAVRMKIS